MRGVGVVVTVLATLVSHVCAFTALIHYGEVRCFWDVVPEPSKISVGFIVSGGFNDIGYSILGVTGETIYDDSKVTEVEVVVTAEEPGKYSYCFDNRFGSAVEKAVTFNTDIYPNEVAAPSNKDSQEEDALEATVKELEMRMKELKHAQQYMEVREKAHHDTNNSTNNRVLYWSIFEMCLLVVVSIGQIYYLKLFFSDERVV